MASAHWRLDEGTLTVTLPEDVEADTHFVFFFELYNPASESEGNEVTVTARVCDTLLNPEGCEFEAVDIGRANVVTGIKFDTAHIWQSSPWPCCTDNVITV